MFFGSDRGSDLGGSGRYTLASGQALACRFRRRDCLDHSIAAVKDTIVLCSIVLRFRIVILEVFRCSKDGIVAILLVVITHPVSL